MKVVVVGAGIAGLTAAWRLARAGHEVLVLEAGERVGGRMSSADAGGFRFDRGAHVLLDSYTRTRALAAEVGVDRQWFAFGAGRGGGIVREPGRVDVLVSKRPLDMLSFSALSVPERVRLLRGLLGARRFRKRLDFYDLSIGPDAHDNEDLATFSASLLGSAASEQLVDSFVRTFHFHGADKMSARYLDALLALIWQGEDFELHGFRGYMQTLPDAIASRLDVRLQSPVQRVVSTPHGWVVESEGDEVSAQRVVVAVPADVAARIIVGAGHPVRAMLEGCTYAPSMIAAFTTSVGQASAFEAIWVPFSVSQLVSGVSNEASKGSVDGERCVFSVGLHEEGARRLWTETDDVVLDTIANEVERIVPDYQGPLRSLALVRWASAMPVYSPGHVGRVRRFWREGQGRKGLFLCGDYLNHPWVEGAVRSGERVAALVDAAAVPVPE
ncbi:MAG: NAD(P)/FAD-dependent oxidoreductase [Myxococcota bacterium]